MASLLKKIFETMPLVGVMGALTTVDSHGHVLVLPEAATLGQMRQYVGHFWRLPAKHIAFETPPSKADVDRKDWSRVPIWGWEVHGDPSVVERVTCRVRDDHFNNYLVLEKLEWGHATAAAPKAFTPAALIELKGRTCELPFDMKYHLMSFVTHGGRIQAGRYEDLWPLESHHDQSLVHVFVYDVDRTTMDLVPLVDPTHPQLREVDEMLKRCEQLNTAAYDDPRNAQAFLFQDDLWDTADGKGPPTGTVPEHVALSLRFARIIVACTLTVCRERDDFQPGSPASVGRLYPHVMVASTVPLDRVHAGVRFTRPKTMTLLDAEHCSCDEMLSNIGSLLVADSNDDGMVLDDLGLPAVYWANLFNYYVPDPFADPTLKDKAIPLVVSTKTEALKNTGAVKRDCSDIAAPYHSDMYGQTYDERVQHAPRQGQFDNLHIAPRMTVMTPIDEVLLIPYHTGFVPVVKVKNHEGWKKDWKMDNVVMAPFCAHDCLHIHWRWSDHDNHEEGTWGWGPKKPHKAVGAPMVPLNQDVFLALVGDNAVSYFAQAHLVERDTWQPFCHHGAGYALSANFAAAVAKAASGLILDKMSFTSGTTVQIPTIGSWALFYWRLRYRLEPVEKTGADGTTYWDADVVERFHFIKQADALDCKKY